MMCGTDDAMIRATNETLRLQRPRTLMEGDEVCDFRIYSVEDPGVELPAYMP